MYLLRLPKFLRNTIPDALWEKKFNPDDPSVYLTFDDGPNPEITPFVLKQLFENNAKASFFCIGKNVIEFPGIYEQIQNEGHTVGNHTHNHLKGRRTNSKTYIEDVLNAMQFINTKLFRPPYGSLKKRQTKHLHQLGFDIVMWSLLSGDFDTSITPQRCLENVVFNLKPGDILVLDRKSVV